MGIRLIVSVESAYAIVSPVRSTSLLKNKGKFMKGTAAFSLTNQTTGGLLK